MPLLALPTWRDWAFALKTASAAILALYIAMWVDLPRPYWAAGTVFITSQVLAGATRSKALYRVCGTVLGAIAAVALVPNLVNSPELLSIGIAAWVAICLYFSLLDRTPRSYLFMLAGYTAAIIGFPTVDDPSTVFDTAVARAEEISIGILCASLVSSIVLPQSVAPLVKDRLDLWLTHARQWVIEVFTRTPAESTSQHERLNLASEAIAFDALATPLHYDMSGAERAAGAMATLRQHMLMFLPIVSGASDRITALEKLDAMPEVARKLLDDMADWLASGTTEESVAARLRARADALAPDLPQRPNWRDLLLVSLAARLKDFIDLRQDVRLLQRHIVQATKPSQPLAFRYTAKVREIRHRDRGLALLSAGAAFIAILIACTIWIAVAWPDGSTAAMMTAVGCCLFAAQDDPVEGILAFANSAIIGAIGAAVYLFALLPRATNFEMLVLALFPGLLVCGLMMTRPRVALLGMGIAVNGMSTVALQESYASDFTAFANSAIALVAGMWIAAIVTRLVRSAGVDWSTHRLRDVNRRSLAQAASRNGPEDSIELAALMLDRIGLIAPRLVALPPAEAEWTHGLLGEVRTGINLIEIQRTRRNLSPEARASLDALLDALAAHLRTEATHAPAALLALTDAAIDAVRNDGDSGPRRAALLGLTGLRRSLFPDAPSYVAPDEARPSAEIAA